MKIEWYGQSCFRLESRGSSLVIDPYQDQEGILGLPELHLRADRVLCTHEHFDHNHREAVSLTGNECRFSVSSLNTYHDQMEGKLLGENTVYLVRADDLLAVHLGDLGHELSQEALAQVRGCDVLMVNVGGFEKSEAELASILMHQIEPRILIPMHYRTEKFGFKKMGTVEEFLEGKDNVILYDTPYIEVDSQTPRQIAVLKLRFSCNPC